jgi:Bacterial regulatory proteins, luxR family
MIDVAPVKECTECERIPERRQARPATSNLRPDVIHASLICDASYIPVTPGHVPRPFGMKIFYTERAGVFAQMTVHGPVRESPGPGAAFSDASAPCTRYAAPCPHARGTALTPRELDVMRLVADDHTSQEIGRILLISPRD